MPPHASPPPEDDTAAPQPRPDLSSLPEEFISPRPQPKPKKPEETAEERAERYRRKRQRQVITVITVCSLLFLALVGGFISGELGKDPAESRLTANMCTGELTPAHPEEVTVNIFNMTTKSGMATELAGKFTERKFKTAKVGNYNGPFERPARVSVRAVVKSNAANQSKALAVQRQLPDAVYQQDDKTKAVDVYLIEQFHELNAEVDQEPGGLICR